MYRLAVVFSCVAADFDGSPFYCYHVRRKLSTGFPCDTEAHIEPLKGGGLTVAAPGLLVLCNPTCPSPSITSEFTGCRSLRVFLGAGFIIFPIITIPRPLPYITTHIVYPQFIGLFLRDGVRFFLIIFKIGTLYSPLKVYFPMAVVISGLGLVNYILSSLSIGTWRFTNMSTLLILAGIIVFLMGLLSEQLTNLQYKDSDPKPE